MRRFFIFSILLVLCFAVNAQTPKCGFEMLFKIKPGMSKMEVLDTVFKLYAKSPVSSTVEKLAPYKATGGDYKIEEIMIYDLENPACFHGQRTKFQLEFADNKLYKVYLSTSFVKSAFQDLIANYNELRTVIKPKWAFENETKAAFENFVSFGYDYTKTKKVTKKTEKVSLQYVDAAVNNPNSYYELEVICANLLNTRMESSNY